MMTGFAQTDSTVKPAPDTITVGGMVIIRDKNSKPEPDNNKTTIRIPGRHRDTDKPSNLSTNWLILDLGFSNYNDKTDYSSAEAQAFAPLGTKDRFKLRTGKSRSVNIWFFMQRFNLVKHTLNLKYGLGLELNNYHYDNTQIRFEKKPVTHIVFLPDGDVHKNKLAADYLTVPLMLNFNFTPRREKGFGFSAGISAGYLYSSRQKIKDDGDVDKTKGDLGLDSWKLSYVGELLLGPVKLYGSYAFKTMWDKGLDQVPYNVGFRISSW
jgi:hypothetical protein